ncbi:hypothetical protein KAI46_08650 [bacterium]|nr:hypothetical protein [bacterium]
MIDGDIREIVQKIGLQTCQQVLENTRDMLVENIKVEGLTIHRNPEIMYNTIFGKILISSPYLWLAGASSKPLSDMNISHNGRSETVNRALADFGIEESFVRAAARFCEHYHFEIGSSAVARTTKDIALQAEEYVKEKLANAAEVAKFELESAETMLAELDGCEIRTVEHKPVDDVTQRTPVYNNPIKEKITSWRDVRLGFVRNMDSESKIFVGRMDSYPKVVSQMHSAAILAGMSDATKVVGVADGAPGLSDELKRQFPTMQFILDKTHLKDHLYETADELGIAKNKRAAWVEPHLKSISEGNVETTLRELVEMNAENPNDRLRRLIGYIKRFIEALDYNKFKAKDYPIGSGEIESAHKSIPQKRLKIPGASWKPDSINPILALRVLRADDWWEDFWNQRAEYLLAA